MRKNLLRSAEEKHLLACLSWRQLAAFGLDTTLQHSLLLLVNNYHLCCSLEFRVIDFIVGICIRECGEHNVLLLILLLAGQHISHFEDH